MFCEIRTSLLASFLEAAMNNPHTFETSPPSSATLLVNGQRLPLAGATLLVGRHSANDLVLDHESVSSHHAAIKTKAGGFVLVDMVSTNGTFLNGEKVAEAQLTDNDQIMFGSVEAFFLEPQIDSGSVNVDAQEGPPLTSSPKLVRLPFSFWPRNPIFSFLATVVFGCVFMLTVVSGFASSLFALSVLYVPMTGIRYIKYRVQKPMVPERDPDQRKKDIRSFWWHPAFIGSAFAALLTLVIVGLASSQTNREIAAASEYRAEHQAYLDQHTSFGNQAGYALSAAASLDEGDVITPLVQGIGNYSTTQELEGRIRNAQAKEVQLASTRQDDGAVIFLAVSVLLTVFGVISWKAYSWVKREWTAATMIVVFTFQASAFAQSPSSGLVLDNGWASPMHGGIAAMKELGSLLSPFARPSPNVAPAPDIEIYQGVTYLMPYAEAKQKLGLTQNIVPKNKVITAGFPKDSLFHYAFDGIFDGGFNKLYIVTDKADQVVAVQLVCESPRRDMLRDIYTAPDWSMYNFINNRRKATTRLWVDHQTHFMRSGSWRQYRKVSGYAHPEGKETVIRIDSALMDPDSLKGSNHRGQEWKLLEVSQLYLPKPLMELMLHTISTTSQR